jgi:DNA-binding MarR family transcriptional regulator
MDRTTVTALLKALGRRGLIAIVADSADRRPRRVSLTEAGSRLIAEEIPIWHSEHVRLEHETTALTAKTAHEVLAALASRGGTRPD